MRSGRTAIVQRSDPDAGPAPGPAPTDWLLLALNAARRRKLVAAAVFLLVLAGAAAYLVTRAPTYRVHTTILTQRQQALPSVVRPSSEDLPTRSAWEMIHRRENLVAIVEQAKLLGAGPPPQAARRGWLDALLRGTPEEPDDPLTTLVDVLDRRLLVTVEDGTVTIQIDWNDPHQAYGIVQSALENYLEARHVQEITAIDEVLAILQGRAAALRRNLDEAMEEAQRRPAPPSRPAPVVRRPSPELVQLQSMLDAKQRAVDDLEEIRRRRLAELETQLTQARNTLSEAHPTVIALRKDIESFARESPQLVALRDELRTLRARTQERLAREGVTSATPVPLVVEPGGAREEDQRVREARQQYEVISARISGAQVELDAARTAFKHRYNVIWPPQLPKDPVGPNPVKVLGAGLIAALVAALAAAAGLDVLRGVIVERWQVEKVLELPVIGYVDRK